MKIKDRIALFFTLISTTILFAVLCTVYIVFMKFMEADFFERLTDRTTVTAKLYLEADEISREALSDVRQKYLQKLSGEVIRIYDHNDQATFIGDSAQYWTRSTIDKVRRKKTISFKDGKKQVVGIYYKDNQGDFVILASAHDLGTQERLNKLFMIMLIVFVLISVIVLLLSRLIAEKMLMPLQNFVEEVKKVGFRNMEFRVKENNKKDEINLLTQGFNQLMEELEQAFILQKTFVANASHELRTPITRMMMTAELALSKSRDPEAYQKVIQSILEDTEKMDQIIKGLLALARMDLDLSHSPFSTIRIDQLLHKIHHEWAVQKDLPLNSSGLENPSGLEISGNALLLQIAFDNIISNAFKFSNHQEVVMDMVCSEGFCCVYIHDQGPGIPSEDLEEIFKPFFSRSTEKGYMGEGMGLYIAKKIIDLHKGEILVERNNPYGTTFTVKLPAF